jgi:hypothetical protein
VGNGKETENRWSIPPGEQPEISDPENPSGSSGLFTTLDLDQIFQARSLPGTDYNLSIWSAGIVFHRCLVFLYNFP